jgi:long-chain fatty acid transport protein
MIEAGSVVSRRRIGAASAATAFVAGVLGLIAAPGPEARAAGFAIKEQSASALGNAFAGSTAAAEDISHMFFNPAGLTRHSGHQIAASLSHVIIDTRFEGGEARTAAGAPIGGSTSKDDAATDATVPALYALWDVRQTFDLERNVRIGLGLNAPFGLETDFSDGWVGRYHGLHSELKTININPTVAVEIIDGISFGAGLQAQYADATLTNAIDFGSFGGQPGRQDGRGKVKGDDWGLGYTLGVLYEPWKGTRFGIGYRSEIEHALKGDANFRLDNAGIGRGISGATGQFRDTPAEADLTTPGMLSFGFYHDINKEWAIMGEAQWTRWSSFDELRIEFENPAQPDSVTEEEWKDVWFFAGGVTYKPTSAWTLRTGVAYDQSPVPNSKRTPRIPDQDRTWLALGASYTPLPGLILSAGYTHIFLEDATVNLKSTSPGNRFRGDLEGEFDTSIDIFTVQAQWTF